MDSASKIIATRYARAYMDLDRKVHSQALEAAAQEKLEGLRKVFVAAGPHRKVLTHPAVNSEVKLEVLGKINPLVKPIALDIHGKVRDLELAPLSTYSARYAGTKLTKGLRPDSEFIKKINRRKLPRGIRVVTFWSKNDLMILPPESAILEGAEQVDVTRWPMRLVFPQREQHRALEHELVAMV